MTMKQLEWRKRYTDYIASKKWREMKSEIIRIRGYQCEWCGRDDIALQLHHKTYKRLGDELPCDLELLCLECHEIADAERAAESRRRSAIRRYNAGLDTYATKKYGDDWFERGYADQIENEFDEWLEQQDD